MLLKRVDVSSLSSLKEGLAIEAVLHENYVRYLTTLTIVNAIITVGNQISSAVSSGGSSGSGDALKKTLDELRLLLIPGEKERAAEKVRRVKETLEREVSKGSFKIKPMSSGKKGKKKGSMKKS